ncbi:hypothetical protein HD806DRAFT_541929 [Xylariaceae sp. AK1471]|nr:hypothetical protein HD806DRAFT_541929 [Xylariaceae sp. AK1471]
MAEGNDENPNNGPGNPFAFVLIPIVGFGLIASLITCYRYRRKKRLARLFGDPQLLESGRHRRTQLDRGPNGVIIITTNGQTGRGTGGRRSGRLGLGVGVGSREEGLNELGEAPPAYMPPDNGRGPKPPGENGGGGENIELATYSQATAEAGMSRSPPEYGEDPPPPLNGPATGAGTGRRSASDDPRASEEASTRDATRNTTTAPATMTPTPTTNEPVRPSRAVLPSS